jgi:uncharacterized protein (DUF433 family)
MSSHAHTPYSWTSGSPSLAARVSPEALIADRIAQNPHKPTPDEVVIAGTGIPVWAIVAHAHALGADLERVASDYEISVASVVAAIVYYHQNRELIEARLLANEFDAE